MDSNKTLYGKRILFFSQYFFGYEYKIAKKMEELGAVVFLYDEMSVKKPLERALLKISSKIFAPKTRKYYDDILRNIRGEAIDYILFIDCEMPDESTLKKYRKQFPNARFCLHLWDSLSNLKGVEKKFGFFDVITTFDREDSIKYNITLRPLFFCDEYRPKEEKPNYKYELSFIGTIHSDRLKVLNAVKKQLDSERIFVYPYLQSKFIYYLYKYTKLEFRDTKSSDFCYKKLESSKIAEIVSESKCVLDIQHPRQSGLTMRTLEIAGMQKKVITTNKDISNYDIFYPSNIYIIDREKPELDKSFFDSEYVVLPEDVYEYYSIGRWVTDVLGV